MTNIQTPFLEFIELLARHLKELEQAYPERYSTDWPFVRYLRRVAKRAMASTSPREVSGAMRGFLRFYVDSIDARSDLGARYVEVLEAHRRALRLERPEG